jgi:diguanylate cyclase (GGDEF)-like protein
MRSMSELDHVTGLATRGELHRVLEAEQGAVALVICDVVGLKAVNERDGFLAGDAVLRQAAERLRHASADAELVARLGGDELVVIFVGLQALADAEAAAAAVAGPGAPGMRAAAVAAIAAEPAGSLIERAYAAMRRS